MAATMKKKVLSEHDQQLLREVLSTVQGDQNKIPDAVKTVIAREPPTRRQYLNRTLSICARKKLRAIQEPHTPFKDDTLMVNYARLHEAEITYGLSSDD